MCPYINYIHNPQEVSMFWNANFRRKLLIGGIPLFTILLIVAASLNYIWARSTLERQTLQGLNEDWAAMKGYLRIEYDPGAKNQAAQWYYDSDDPDQAAVVTSIRGRCFIADENGRVLH